MQQGEHQLFSCAIRCVLLARLTKVERGQACAWRCGTVRRDRVRAGRFVVPLWASLVLHAPCLPRGCACQRPSRNIAMIIARGRRWMSTDVDGIRPVGRTQQTARLRQSQTIPRKKTDWPNRRTCADYRRVIFARIGLQTRAVPDERQRGHGGQRRKKASWLNRPKSSKA